MGLLIDEAWSQQGHDSSKSGGGPTANPTRFRDWISADGSTGFAAEAGRCRLAALPWQ